MNSLEHAQFGFLPADAFMKGSLQFEGPNTAGSDGYRAGFGIIAEPTTKEVDLTGDQRLRVLCLKSRTDFACPHVLLEGRMV